MIKYTITKSCIQFKNKEDLYPVLDIYSNQQYHIFEKAETGRLVKKTMTKIRVRLEPEK